MCGIIGITGSANAPAILLAGLQSLEYRGYDSAGVAIIDADDDSLWRFRTAEGHSIEKLATALDGAPGGVAAAIGHTRWATHGAPTEHNAHPHLDCTGRIALVHNGIIENHRELAAELVSAGHVFASETDTEVVAHLVEAEMAEDASLFVALQRVVAELRGDFALAVVAVDEPDVIVAARRTAPLVLGLTETSGLVASDIAALLSSTRDLYLLADGEVAEVRGGSLTVVNERGAPVQPRPLEVTWDVADAQKGGYPDFMSKEIREQPRAVAETLIGRIREDASTELEELALGAEELSAVRRVLFVACGSSYHAALVGRHAVEQWAHLPAEVDIASEFRYRGAVLDPHTLVVAVSQSGETTDTLHTMHKARLLGATALAMTNVVDSVMAREADGVLYTHAGPEIGVASTKCHLAQLALLETLALHLGGVRGAMAPAAARAAATSLLALPAAVEATLEHLEEYAAVAERFAATEDFYFLGRRLGYPVAMEGALKLKELAYVRAEAYAAGEMKHGPISLIEPGCVVVVIATRTALWEKVMGNVAEVRARGATVLALCDEGDEETASLVDATLMVPSTPELLSPVVGVVPLQCFAYAIARARGNDVDRPRNLAKVVTVE